MIATIIEFSRYFMMLLYGTALAVSFAGMNRTRKNYLIVLLFNLFLFALQVTSLGIWGMDVTIKIYPLLSHFPLTIFIMVYLKRSFLIALTSMFVSFLCSQPPRWFGAVTGGAFKSATMDHAGFIAAAILIFLFMRKYVSKSIRHLMERSVKSCMLFGAVPAFFYIFDYVANVYTDFMYTGVRAAVQFMPFVTSAFYLVFVLLYYAETQKQANIQRERDMLDTQLKIAQAEFASLRQLQHTAATYRHDMRHHFALLQSLAARENIAEIKEYLKNAQSDIDAFTPIRYCENETVNLIISAYTTKAKQADTQFLVDACLPDVLPFSDTELCSLLSNALENAIMATSKISHSQDRQIKFRMFSKNNKLCLDIRNSYETEPIFEEGLPIQKEEGHGYGTKSMAHIVEKHGGVYQFLVKDGWFIFQATA